MRRKIGSCTNDEPFLKKCRTEFESKPENVISRNSINSVGLVLSCTDSKRKGEISHVFLHTLKKKNTKATNQGRSGRCWMFAGLNMFRHSVISALNMDNFEFSETFLFFWDKYERINKFIHSDVELGSREYEYLKVISFGDGGYWSMFANLVEKYGLVPQTVMQETYQSFDTEAMNQILKEMACNALYAITKAQEHEEIRKIRNECMKSVYDCLVKFLGEPPTTFDWSYSSSDNESHKISGLTPKSFKAMILPSVSLKDFVCVANIPSIQYCKMYDVRMSTNMIGGENFKFLNLRMSELKSFAKKSILSGMPVWFAGDVTKGYNPYESTLDEKLLNTDIVFGKPIVEMSKAAKINFGSLEANHAMALSGINFVSDEVGVCSEPNVKSWQVENSWGYYDNESPGLDGFLFMSNEWFENNVLEIVIHKNYLSRLAKNYTKKEPITLDPWHYTSKSLLV